MSMRVCAVGPALVMARRAGVVAGLMFGLGLLAVLVADRAAAEEERSDVGALVQPLVRTGGEVLSPVVGVVAPVVKPVVSVTEPVVKPVVSVVKPVVSVVKPVLSVVKPVVSVVTPVVDVVSPVTEPVGSVVEPVPADSAVERGLDEAAPPVTAPRPEDEAGDAVPVRQEVLPVTATPVAAVPSVAVPSAVEVPRSRLEPGVVHEQPRPERGVPGSPVHVAVTGGGTVGGSGGTHAADGAVPAAAGADRWHGGGRAPPGAITGTPWLGHDDRHHPS